MDFIKLQELAKQKGMTDIEIYKEVSTGVSISVYKGNIEKSQFESTSVLAIRGVYDNKLGIYYTEKEDDDFSMILDRLIENIKLQTITEPYFIYQGDSEYPVVTEVEPDFDQFTLKDKIDACLALEKRILEYDSLVADCSNVDYSEQKKECLIQNSNGLELKRRKYYAYFVGEAIIKKGDEVKTNYEFQLRKQYKDFDLETLAKKIVTEGISQLGGAPCQSGFYSVVMRNETMSDLLGAFTGLFSGEMAIKNMTFLKGQEGMKIFGDNITIIDDPLDPNALNNYAFDDEGVSSKTKDIVKDGVFQTMLHNLKTAKMFDVASTGNGYKAAPQTNVSVFPTNLRLKGGQHSFQDLLLRANNGIYITNLMGLHAGVNTISGDFSLQASGYTIVDGMIKDPVTLIILSGSIQEILKNVEMLGNDVFYNLSNIGAPSVLFKSIAVVGK